MGSNAARRASKTARLAPKVVGTPHPDEPWFLAVFRTDAMGAAVGASGKTPRIRRDLG